jgi:hypothetical protein
MTATITATGIGVRLLAGNIGAEISRADTSQPLADETVAAIRQALLDHKVVFLRDQRLDYEGQVAFAERLGPLTLGHPTLESPAGQPLLEEIDSFKGGRVNYWHTDVTFVDQPPRSPCCTRRSSRRRAVTPCGRTPSPATRRCQPPCASWRTSCASCTPTTSTTRGPTAGASG